MVNKGFMVQKLNNFTFFGVTQITHRTESYSNDETESSVIAAFDVPLTACVGAICLSADLQGIDAGQHSGLLQQDIRDTSLIHGEVGMS